MWCRVSVRRYGSFKAADLAITTRTELKPIPELRPDIVFGKHTSDHMLVIKWKDDEGWRNPEILPYENFNVDPSSAVLHYAGCCFEGMKAYKNDEGRVLMFRPNRNLERLNASCDTLMLPTFDINELMRCMEKLLEIDSNWVP
jgi:branched-chain amino acid aminotransferase